MSPSLHYAFAAVARPFDTVRDLAEAWFARYYHERESAENRAQGLGGNGVTRDGMRSFAHDRPEAVALGLADVYPGDLRLVALQGQPGWTLFDSPTHLKPDVDPMPDVFSKILDTEVFQFGCRAGQDRVQTNFHVHRPDAGARSVAVFFEDVLAKGRVTLRHRFGQRGAPHPAEDLASYARRGPRNKLGPDELAAIRARIGLDAEAYIETRTAARAVIIAEMPPGTPLAPSPDAIAAIDRLWPWKAL